MHSFVPLFLEASYRDGWACYEKSCRNSGELAWDYVILTAANENQAEGYRLQLLRRREFLPARTHFAVLPDEGGIRIGSGGSTLSVLRYIWSREQERTGTGRFSGLKILCIHSGGDSKRVPQYSAGGKLFSPMPRCLPDGRGSALFDELMIAMSAVAMRLQEGMVLLSGDVFPLFNPLQLGYLGTGAAAVAIQEKVSAGTHHGVFLADEEGCVKSFLHKKPETVLRELGAVDGQDRVSIDTGMVMLAPDVMESLYSLVHTEQAYHEVVNGSTPLSLYGDFLYSMAGDSTLEAYQKEKPEGEFSRELTAVREKVWQKLHGYRLKLRKLSPAKFLHIGTSREVLELMTKEVRQYGALDWKAQVGSCAPEGVSAYYSTVQHDARIGENCYLENTWADGGTVGSGSILSGVSLQGEQIPPHVVLHQLKLRNGDYVCRIYGVEDDPKESRLFGRPMAELMDGLGSSPIWDREPHILWNAKIYPECSSPEEALAAALNLYALTQGKGNLSVWENSRKMALSAGAEQADPQWIIQQEERMQQQAALYGLLRDMRRGVPAKKLAPISFLTDFQKEQIKQMADSLDYMEKFRFWAYLGTVLGEDRGDACFQTCFREISATVMEAEFRDLPFRSLQAERKKKYRVEFPLRVNWAGGWSDTPPICFQGGGTVLNAAVRICGRLPVQAVLTPIGEHKIILDSRDLDVHGEFTEIADLQSAGDPGDPFALQKACLLACGTIPLSGGELEELFSQWGGGFVLRSEIYGVPKGSGLGTSSILAAACVKALLEFSGKAYTVEDLYARTLMAEQIMSTGGGWQDQVGGILPGIKFITSRPGLDQTVTITRLRLQKQVLQELNARFCLIYTGQRRLARNLLRDVVSRYLTNEPEMVQAIQEIQRVAVQMKAALEQGDVDGFARLLNRHWSLSRQIHSESSNQLIEQIFEAIEDLIDGRMVCGAGGGGFLQAVTRKGVSGSDVRKRLKEVFGDCAVDVWECELVYTEADSDVECRGLPT